MLYKLQILCCFETPEYLHDQELYIYIVSCDICKLNYIGETQRTLNTRIKEHFTINNSAVKQHNIVYHPGSDPFNIFTFNTLHTNLSNYSMRMYVEALYINKFSNTLMNGCKGADLL